MRNGNRFLLAGLVVLCFIGNSQVEAKSINAYVRDALGADFRLSDLRGGNNFESIRSLQIRAGNSVESAYLGGKLTQVQYLDLRAKLASVAAKEQVYEAQGKISSKERLKQMARLYEIELQAKKGSGNKLSGLLGRIAKI